MMGNMDLSHNIKRLETEHKKLKQSMKGDASLKISQGSVKALKDSVTKKVKPENSKTN